jgi:hypothetical protein
MREILFRGKPTEQFAAFKIIRPELFEGDWVYGSLIVCEERYYICTYAACSNRTIINNAYGTMVEVIPETVGQFTNRVDINGWKIFEGDIVRAKMDYGPGGALDNTTSIGFDELFGYNWDYFYMDTIEVVGNIHDNPELLKGE